MDRRNFLKTGSAAAASALTPYTVSQNNPNAAVQSSSVPGRLMLPINRNWRYSPTNTDAAHAKDFDDSPFRPRHHSPHQHPLPWHSFDEKSYEFVSIYRRRFKLPAEAEGKRVFVDFEGVMTASTVWINGTRLGEYKGGYTPFSFELTPHIDFDGDNVLAVEVDSTERADIPPFGYQIDYLTFGGIYREVSLRIVPQTFIENIFAQPKDVLSGKPTVDVHAYSNMPRRTRSRLTLKSSCSTAKEWSLKATQNVPPGKLGARSPSAHTSRWTISARSNSGI